MMGKELGIKNRRKGKRYDLIQKSTNDEMKNDNDIVSVQSPRTPSTHSNPMADDLSTAFGVVSQVSRDESSDHHAFY
jgi:hypothetical protein